VAITTITTSTRPTGGPHHSRPTPGANSHSPSLGKKFPFLTGRRRNLVLTSLHLLLDTGANAKGCHNDMDPLTTTIVFTPSSSPRHHPTGGTACVDTEDILLVRVEGGMLKGSLVLKTPVALEDGRGEGMVGRFSLPCELKGLCGAWLLCSYRSQDRECRD